MTSWAPEVMDQLWRNAVGIVPLAMVAAGVCRWVPLRPVTRHALWAMVLSALLVPPFLPMLRLPDFPMSTRSLEGAVGVSEIAPQSEQAIGGPSRVLEPRATRTERFESGGVEPGTKGAGVESKKSKSKPTRRKEPARVLPRVFHAPAEDSRVARSESGRTGSVSVSRPWRPARAEASDGLEPPVAVAGRPEAGSDTGVARVSGESCPGGRWGEWLAGLGRIRDAVGGLPAVPSGFWVAGVVVLVLGRSAGVWVFLRRMREARMAGPGVRRMVTEIAGELGLRRVPVTKTLDRRVSPMVMWWGRRWVLLLPEGLWSELDETGRRAILCHELAHVRRRDHWVSLCSHVLVALYWWHPLVWWVRGRLSEEAELCCDAWVTWLMPTGRRAYAEALLHTREFVHGTDVKVPVTGIGVMSARAKWFARRLKMVMTESKRPGMSMAGISLALSLALVGWLAVPSWAGSGTEGEAKVSAKCSAKCDGKCKTECPAGCCAKSVKASKCCASGKLKSVAPAPSVSVGVAPGFAVPRPKGLLPPGPVGFVLVGDSDDDEEGRSLEDRLEQLERMVRKLAERLDEGQAVAPHGSGSHGRWEPGPESRGKREPRAPRRPRAPRASRAPRGLFAPQAVGPNGGETETRAYHLPKGKLKALTALMVRSDVPIMVSPGKDRLEVQATADQHAIFGAFVNLIHPGEDGAASARSMAEMAAKLRVLADAREAGVGEELRMELMARLAGDRSEVMREALEGERERLEEERDRIRQQFEEAREAMHEAMEQQRESMHDGLERERAALERERSSIRQEMERERESLREALEREREDMERERDQLHRVLEQERRSLEQERDSMHQALERERQTFEQERQKFQQQVRE